MKYTNNELKALAGKSYTMKNETITITNQGFVKYGNNKFNTLGAALDAVAYKLGMSKNSLRSNRFVDENGKLLYEDLKEMIGKENPANKYLNEAKAKCAEAETIFKGIVGQDVVIPDWFKKVMIGFAEDYLKQNK